jgi:F-type H+-transporting ATPase subunit epsilon
MDQPWEFMLIRPTRLSLPPCQLSSTPTAMSTATWRQFFTYHIFLLKLYCRGVLIVNFFNRYNKYTQIAARAVRQSLKENERVAAEKRGLTALRYQHWENGKGGEQVLFFSSRSYVMESADTRNRHLRCISTRLLTRHSALSQARCSPTVEAIIFSIPVTRREPDT